MVKRKGQKENNDLQNPTQKTNTITLPSLSLYGDMRYAIIIPISAS
jgi:hypothetical protein